MASIFFSALMRQAMLGTEQERGCFDLHTNNLHLSKKKCNIWRGLNFAHFEGRNSFFRTSICHVPAVNLTNRCSKFGALSQQLWRANAKYWQVGASPPCSRPTTDLKHLTRGRVCTTVCPSLEWGGGAGGETQQFSK